MLPSVIQQPTNIIQLLYELDKNAHNSLDTEKSKRMVYVSEVCEKDNKNHLTLAIGDYTLAALTQVTIPQPSANALQFLSANSAVVLMRPAALQTKMNGTLAYNLFDIAYAEITHPISAYLNAEIDAGVVDVREKERDMRQSSPCQEFFDNIITIASPLKNATPELIFLPEDYFSINSCDGVLLNTLELSQLRKRFVEPHFYQSFTSIGTTSATAEAYNLAKALKGKDRVCLILSHNPSTYMRLHNRERLYCRTEHYRAEPSRTEHYRAEPRRTEPIPLVARDNSPDTSMQIHYAGLKAFLILLARSALQYLRQHLTMEWPIQISIEDWPAELPRVAHQEPMSEGPLSTILGRYEELRVRQGSLTSFTSRIRANRSPMELFEPWAAGLRDQVLPLAQPTQRHTTSPFRDKQEEADLSQIDKPLFRVKGCEPREEGTNWQLREVPVETRAAQNNEKLSLDHSPQSLRENAGTQEVAGAYISLEPDQPQLQQTRVLPKSAQTPRKPDQQ